MESVIQGLPLIGSYHRGRAQVLVSALENFIVPLIVGLDSPQRDKLDTGHEAQINRSERDLTKEASRLLDALSQFILSVTAPRSDVEQESGRISDDSKADIDTIEDYSEHHENMEGASTDQKDWKIEQEDQLSIESKALEVKIPTQPASTSKLLGLALEKAYRMVYNEMPIRLLKFNTDGSDIRLVERPEIWQNVSRCIEQNFVEDEAIVSGLANKSELEDLTEDDQKLFYDIPYRHTQFAILSHTWLQSTPGEVTYGNWLLGAYDKQSGGYKKLVDFCRITATEHNMTLGWMDTICINKESSSELDESIRSMYKWYLRSYPCIVYLADTTSLEHMHADRWFTRGWTLQEFIAPKHIKFYTADWTRLSNNPNWANDKESIDIWEQISRATTILQSELQRGHMQVPISRRMQWAASRRVTREEDSSYSLMGIFDVSIATAYGEGAERAFERLVREILNVGPLGVQDVVNWGWGPMSSPEDRLIGPRRASALLPRGPRAYSWRSDDDVNWMVPYKPITMTHIGLHVSVLLLPSLRIKIPNGQSPSFGIYQPRGNYFGTAFAELRNHSSATGTYTGLSRYEYRILDRSIFEEYSSTWKLERGTDIAFLGVLNTVDHGDSPVYVQLPPSGSCYAVELGSTTRFVDAKTFGTGEAWAVAAPTRPITFDIKYHGDNLNPELIPASDFLRHGMDLRTLYL